MNSAAGLTSKESTAYKEIKKNPSLTSTQLAAILGVSRATVERIVKNLKKQGYIIRNGSNKYEKWIPRK